MVLRRLTHLDLPAVAAVHRAAFPNAALSLLGNEAVRRYYDTLLSIGSLPDRSFGIGVFAGRRLAGFCFVGRRFELEPEFIRHHRWFLVQQILRSPEVIRSALFRNRMFRGLRHLLGHLTGRPLSPPSGAARSTPSFGVQYIVVHPDYQKLGVGRRLLEAAEDRARAVGRQTVELSVFTDNEPAIVFYERHGWNKVLSGDRWSGLMAKNLAVPGLMAVQTVLEVL